MNSERQRRFKLKKKESLESSSNLSPKSNLFKTPQVKGKCLKKVRSVLTGTVEQNKNVLKTLMNEIVNVNPSQSELTTGYSLPQETVRKVLKFYNSLEISRSSPRAADFVTIIDNVKRFVRGRILAQDLLHSQVSFRFCSSCLNKGNRSQAC